MPGVRVGSSWREVLFVPEREFLEVEVRDDLYAEGHSRQKNSR